MATSLVNRIGGHGGFAIMIAHQIAKLKAHCDEYDIPLPFPEQMMDFPVVALVAMSRMVNYELPPDMKIKISVAAVPQPSPDQPHKHYDRHGAEISCTTYQFLHQRDDYGVVGMWESDNGNTVVSTIWIGDEDCRFQTRVMSTDIRWNHHVVNHPNEAAAVAGHQGVIDAVRAYPPQ